MKLTSKNFGIIIIIQKRNTFFFIYFIIFNTLKFFNLLYRIQNVYSIIFKLQFLVIHCNNHITLKKNLVTQF
jgi:hypothetical protein